ncbi:hypothetical protein IW261DRAFT_1657365, partial [Armillaria novae-zelandiae]
MLDNFFGRQFNLLNNIKVHPSSGKIFFTDVIYTYPYGFHPCLHYPSILPPPSGYTLSAAPPLGEMARAAVEVPMSGGSGRGLPHDAGSIRMGSMGMDFGHPNQMSGMGGGGMGGEFANVLEQLESSFYQTALSKFQASDFTAAGFVSPSVPMELLDQDDDDLPSIDPPGEKSSEIGEWMVLDLLDGSR